MSLTLYRTNPRPSHFQPRSMTCRPAPASSCQGPRSHVTGSPQHPKFILLPNLHRNPSSQPCSPLFSAPAQGCPSSQSCSFPLLHLLTGPRRLILKEYSKSHPSRDPMADPSAVCSVLHALSCCPFTQHHLGLLTALLLHLLIYLPALLLLRHSGFCLCIFSLCLDGWEPTGQGYPDCPV